MKIAFEGDPESDNFSGSPCNMPKNLSAIAGARLIREGFDVYQKHYFRVGRAKAGQKPLVNNLLNKTEVVRKISCKPVFTLKITR